MGHKGDYGAPAELLRLLHLTLLFVSLLARLKDSKTPSGTQQADERFPCAPRALCGSLLQLCVSWLHKERHWLEICLAAWLTARCSSQSHAETQARVCGTSQWASRNKQGNGPFGLTEVNNWFDSDIQRGCFWASDAVCISAIMSHVSQVNCFF